MARAMGVRRRNGIDRPARGWKSTNTNSRQSQAYDLQHLLADCAGTDFEYREPSRLAYILRPCLYSKARQSLCGYVAPPTLRNHRLQLLRAHKKRLFVTASRYSGWRYSSSCHHQALTWSTAADAGAWAGVPFPASFLLDFIIPII